MRWNTLVLHELVQRKSKFITSLLTIALGITVIVAINTITVFSEKAVAKQLDALGANLLILPKSVSVNDYYTADLQSDVLPEEYVTLLTTSNLEGLDNLSPRISLPVTLKQKKVVLTGILPKNEFESKASWQGDGVFTRPKSCGAVEDIFGLNTQKQIGRKRVIEDLEADELLVGSDLAQKLKLKEGMQITMLNKPFKVLSVLPQTGTTDDARVFAHLHTVQTLTGKDAVINAIEVVGCCEKISKGLVTQISKLIPDSKVVTISQIVDTQIKTNHIMHNISKLFLLVIIVISAAAMANDMYSNVYERRKEIGMLVSLGASSKNVYVIFLYKAFILGVIGGLIGYIFGTILAILLGPMMAGITVLPKLSLLGWSLTLSVSIALLASYFPARYASRLDPCAALQET
jgi:putative ABC transport system permease protein